MLNSKALITQPLTGRVIKTGSKAATDESISGSTTVSAMSRTKSSEYESGSEWNPASFDRVVVQYQSRIYRFIYAMVGDAEMAHDLTQDTFLSAYKSLLKRAEAVQAAHEAGAEDELERYNPANNNISAWLYTIARNTALSEMRRHKVVRFFSFWQRPSVENNDDEFDGLADIAALEPGGDVEARSALRDELQRAMTQIGREKLIALLLHMDGFSYKEICQITGDSLPSVKSQIFRAKESLRRILSAQNALDPSAGFAGEGD
jgi:RNA polymerase sigma-70 factor (ECF subfamily)